VHNRERLHAALDCVLDFASMRRVLDEVGFKEADHPRRKDGKFGEGGGSSELSAPRGHVDKDAYLTVPVKERVGYVAKELGVSKAQARKYVSATITYSGPSYSEVRSGEDKVTADALEAYIAVAPKWDGNGPLYRGVRLRDADLAALTPGASIDMRGMSSWSSDNGVALSFAKRTSGSERRVMFEVDKGDTATSIKHLSESPTEDEVLFSGKTRFEVVSTENRKMKRARDKGRAYGVQVVKVREVAA